MEAFLDTHVLIWLCAGEASSLSPSAIEAIEEGEMWASPISLLEVDYLREIKRVRVGGSELFEELHRVIGLQQADDLLSGIASIASRLTWTRDPFDRLLVAHATFHHFPLITKDRILRKNYDCIW